MKKSIISMMIIGMMTLSTTSSFGSVNNSHFQTSKTEKVVKYDKNCNCRTCKEMKKQEQIKKQQQKQQKQCNCSTCKKLQKKQTTVCRHQQNKFKR